MRNENAFKDIDCLILSMPFVVVNQPTMGVSVLKSALNNGGVKTDTHYPCLPLSESLPEGMYNWFGSNVYDRIGDYFFSELIFGYESEREEILIKSLKALKNNQRFPKIKDIDNVDDLVDYMPRLRNHIQLLINEIVDLIKQRPNIKIVCCSATFVQLFSSLAILKAIKEERPDIITIIGGCECEGEASKEIVKRFDFIDYACSGEGDVVLVQLCKSILNDVINTQETLPHGIYNKKKAKCSSVESAKAMSNDIPQPDHSSFYKELQYFSWNQESVTNYTFELSRGCWKGQNMHCTFCGLNGMRMTYRKRDVNDVINEISHAYASGKRVLYSVDSVIDLNYMKPVFDYFQSDCPDAIFMCDTVSSLNYKQMEYLSDSGVLIITAGIESLHPIHLKLMNKGPRAIGNIAYLKYAKINHMHILWNMLTAIPGDSPKEYRELSELIPLIEHFTPPSYSIIRFDRHSLYWENPSKYNLELIPMRNAEYLYPKETDIDLDSISMYFDNIAPDAVTSYKDSSLQELFAKIRLWQRHYRESSVLEISDGVIIDTRRMAICPKYFVSSEDQKMLEYLFSPKSSSDTEEFVKNNNLRMSLECLLRYKYVIKWDDSYLSLVTTVIPNERSRKINKRWENIDPSTL